uniref:Non-structural maintenance of chromosomes element 4 n=1 Tax=Petromyzon marinus TaxID=7757 RepID=S4RH10_PETMA
MSRLRQEKEEGEEAMATNGEEDNSEDDERKRQQLRHKYRELIHSLQEDREELIKPDNEGLATALQQSQKLFRSVKETREAAMDSQFLVLAATIGQEKATQLHTGLLDFDEGVFSEHVVLATDLHMWEGEKLGGSDEDTRQGQGGCDDAYVTEDSTCFPRGAWARLATCTSSYMSVVPTFHYMLGTFKADPLPVQRAENKKSRPVKSRTFVLLCVQLKRFEPSSEEATVKEVERIQSVLKENIKINGEKPLVFFEFVINSTSFSCTLENIFHTAFLQRNGKVRISRNKACVPLIGELIEENKGGSKTIEEERNETNQEIMTIDIEIWKELIDLFQIKSSMISPLPDYASH